AGVRRLVDTVELECLGRAAAALVERGDKALAGSDTVLLLRIDGHDGCFLWFTGGVNGSAGTCASQHRKPPTALSWRASMRVAPIAAPGMRACISPAPAEYRFPCKASWTEPSRWPATARKRSSPRWNPSS